MHTYTEIHRQAQIHAWALPTSVSAVKHEKWGMREIIAHLGMMTDTQQVCSAVGKAIAIVIRRFPIRFRPKTDNSNSYRSEIMDTLARVLDYCFQE